MTFLDPTQAAFDDSRTEIVDVNELRARYSSEHGGSEDRSSHASSEQGARPSSEEAPRDGAALDEPSSEIDPADVHSIVAHDAAPRRHLGQAGHAQASAERAKTVRTVVDTIEESAPLAALAQRSAAFRTLEALPAALLVVDEGVIVFANAAAVKLLGASSAALAGARLERILPMLHGTSGELFIDGRPLPLRFRVAPFGAHAPLAGCTTVVLEPAAALRPLPFSMLEVLQLAAMGRRSLVVHARARDGSHGRVVVVDGEGWHAEDRLGVGLPAFVRLSFEAPHIRVSCEELLTRPMMARTIEGTIDGLLLEAARLHDEHTPPRAHEVAPGLDVDGPFRAPASSEGARIA